MDLRQILNLKQDSVLGLDIGSSAIKIIALGCDEDGYKVTAAGTTEIPQQKANIDVYRDATPFWADGTDPNILKAIRDCFAQARLRAKKKLKTRFVVCGVSGPEIAVRDFEFSRLPDEDIKSAVCLEAAQVCPFNADQAYIDYQLIPNGDDKTQGVFAAAVNTLVKKKMLLAQQASLKCVLMDIDGLALLNCFYGFCGYNKNSRAVILNVGGSYTTLAIMNEDGRPFIRDTACAGNDIIRKTAAIADMSLEDVKQALFGDTAQDEVQDKINNSLQKACEDLIIGVSETLRYYATQEKYADISRNIPGGNDEKIYVCGGFALARGFIELLNRRLGNETVLWNPFENARCDATQGCRDILAQAGPSMAIAAGLAMRSI